MLRVLIGISGSGKTYLIQEELIRRHMEFTYNDRNVCVVERKEYSEYSHLFSPDFVSVYKQDSCMVNALLAARNTEIIIDCEDYCEEFWEMVSSIARQARVDNNNVTITLQPTADIINRGRRILMNANEVLVGECGGPGKALVEEVFKVKLMPAVRKFGFYKVF